MRDTLSRQECGGRRTNKTFGWLFDFSEGE